MTTTTPFGVELQQAADKVTATITDKNGAVVRTIDIGELTAGVHSFTWDGTLTDGSTAPNGSYNVAISASNGGTQLVAQPLQFALVQGVIRGNNGNTLDSALTAPPPRRSTADNLSLHISGVSHGLFSSG